MDLPTTRSKRLKERIVEKKESEGEKRKKTSEAIKPKSGGKDGMIKPINARGPSMVNVKEKHQRKVKRSKEAKKAVTSRVLKRKETADGHGDESSSGDDDVNMATNDALKSVPKLVDADEDSASLVEDDKETKTRCDIKLRGAAGNMKPKKAAVKDEVKVTVKPTDGTEDDGDEDSAGLVEDDRTKKTRSHIKSRGAAGNNKPKKPTDETEDESSSGDDDANMDTNDALNHVPKSVDKDSVGLVEDDKKKKTPSDIKLRVAAGNVKPKKAAVKDEVKVTVKPTDGTEDDGDEDSAGLVEDVRTKKTRSHIKSRGTAGNNKPKKPTDGTEDDSSSGESDDFMAMVDGSENDAPEHSNDRNSVHELNLERRIFKIVSRIECKLDDLVCEQVNEKIMFAILLRMPFHRREDVAQYELDLRDANLFLKFAKYFENVGGKSNGKKINNMLHKIATPDVLGLFDWKSNSADSFQRFQNIIRLIHTSAKVICTPYDETVGGEIIKTTLRNARGAKN